MNLKSAELVRLLESYGFYKVSQKGSHLKMRNAMNTTIIVPVHTGDMKTGLLSAILKKAGIEVDPH